MAFDIELAARIRRSLAGRHDVVEKRMFGGLCFMVKGHMCCGAAGNDLVLRVGAERFEQALKRPHARPMDFTGKPLKGFVYVSPEGVGTRRQLDEWLAMALANVESLPMKPERKRKLKRKLKRKGSSC